MPKWYLDQNNQSVKSTHVLGVPSTSDCYLNFRRLSPPNERISESLIISRTEKTRRDAYQTQSL